MSITNNKVFFCGKCKLEIFDEYENSVLCDGKCGQYYHDRCIPKIEVKEVFSGNFDKWFCPNCESFPPTPVKEYFSNAVVFPKRLEKGRIVSFSPNENMVLRNLENRDNERDGMIFENIVVQGASEAGVFRSIEKNSKKRGERESKFKEFSVRELELYKFQVCEYFVALFTKFFPPLDARVSRTFKPTKGIVVLKELANFSCFMLERVKKNMECQIVRKKDEDVFKINGDDDLMNFFPLSKDQISFQIANNLYTHNIYPWYVKLKKVKVGKTPLVYLGKMFVYVNYELWDKSTEGIVPFTIRESKI